MKLADIEIGKEYAWVRSFQPTSLWEITKVVVIAKSKRKAKVRYTSRWGNNDTLSEEEVLPQWIRPDYDALHAELELQEKEREAQRKREQVARNNRQAEIDQYKAAFSKFGIVASTSHWGSFRPSVEISHDDLLKLGKFLESVINS